MIPAISPHTWPDYFLFQALETLDNGMPYSDAKEYVQFSADVFRYYGGWADKIVGETIPVGRLFFSILEFSFLSLFLLYRIKVVRGKPVLTGGLY